MNETEVAISDLEKWIEHTRTSAGDKRLFVSLKEITEITGLSDSTIKRRRDQGDFPEPMFTHKAGVRWLLSDIEHWIRDLPDGEIEAGDARLAATIRRRARCDS